MLSKPIPLWIIAGGLVLTGGAGMVNAVGFLGLHHQALSHLTGTITGLGIGLGQHNLALIRHAAGIVGGFFFGAVLSGMITRHSTLRLGRRYGAALGAVSLLLLGATYFLRHGSLTGDYLAAMACGLQNAMATSYSGAVVRTTHVTGIITDLGIAVGLAARREPVDWRRMRLYLVLLGGFLGGGVLGTLAFSRFGHDTLLLPAGITGISGVGYAIIKHSQRVRARAAGSAGPSPE